MKTAGLSAYLDTPHAISQYDPKDMTGWLADFPSQLEKAQTEFSRLALPAELAQVKQVIFCGMGGSAIGARLACDLPANLKRKPLFVVNDYDLPGWVGAGTAVVIVSYSGNTAEVLSCFSQAQSKGALIIAITSGGELARLTKESGATLYQFEYNSPQPRAALGYLLAPAIILLARTGVIESSEADFSSAIKLMHDLTQSYQPSVPTAKNRAKELAYKLYDRIPLIIGSGLTSSAAKRWKNQFNENSKNASWFEDLPEANHNAVEGFSFPARFKDDVAIIFLSSRFDHPAVIKRQSIWRQHLVDQGFVVETIEAPGDDLWSNKLSLVYLGDWVSYYLALLNHTDPEPIPVISELKKRLD